MNKIVGVTFSKNGRITYCDINDFDLKIDTNVIVDIEEYKRFAKVATEVHEIDETKLDKPLPKIVSIATKKDYYTHVNNIKDASKAFKKCVSLIKKYKLDMRIIETYYTFNRDHLIFRFYSESRVDFRNLAKELASLFKTRIELRQIGVRDKAKEVGGVGVCGQKLCCARFLKEFDSVSIAMAKNQNLALSPNKINGICGRLLCCLKYEDDCYCEIKKNLPTIGNEVTVEGNKGKVVSINILKNSYTVEFKNGSQSEVKINGDT